MKLQQLKYFATVVKTGFNISEAARLLHTSQPGVSRQLMQLEQELGVPLLRRTKNSIVGLTEDAQPILELAARVLADVEGIKRLAHGMQTGEPKSVTVVTTHSFARHMVAEPLSRLSGRQPLVRVTINQSSSEGALQQVLSGEADVALNSKRADNLELYSLPIFKLPRVLAAPKGHPILECSKISMDEIARHPHVAYPQAFAARRSLDEAFAANHLKCNVVITATDADMVMACVSKGLGIAILTTLSTQDIDTRRVSLAPLDHLFDPVIAYITIRRESVHNRAVMEFLQSLVPWFRQADPKLFFLQEVEVQEPKVWPDCLTI
jgi:LysR family cys regulon transcriptional activator